MPDQKYEASRQTIGVLLSTTSPRIEVPEWQRSYSWGSDEIEAFWQDLIAFDKQYPEGNIVGEEYFLGSTVLVTGGHTNLLLDGQQRLATATILLSVFRDFRREYNGDAATRLQNKYIADFDDATGATTPVLTLNVYDREYFRAEVQEEMNVDSVRPQASLKSHGLVRKARDYFAERVREENATADGGKNAFDRNLRLGRVLCDHMSVVVVSSTDEDNAAAVFETLNDRGIGLSTPDLLRNLLLRRAVDQDACDRVVAAWQVVLGIADEASVDEFLRHFWVSHRGDVKSRKLYREIKDKIESEEVDSVQFSLDLAAAAPIYRDIVRAQSNDAALRHQLEAVRALGAKVLYPAILSALSIEGADAAEVTRLTEGLVTLFVRYNVIGARESTTLESVIFGTAAALRDDSNIDGAIGKLKALSPEPRDFVERFRRVSVTRIATARYLLREIEHAKRETGEVSVAAPHRVHVEHIYPQTPVADTKWTNHSKFINRLGNLTLLGKALNISIKNGDFATKKAQGYAGSDILMTKELLAVDTWDEEAISIRQDELSNWAFDIWHFPGEELPSARDDTSEAVATEPEPSVDDLPEVPV